MIEPFAILPVLLTVAGAVTSGWKTVNKLRTRVDLSKAIRANINEADTNELTTQLNTNKLEAAAAVIRKCTDNLSPAEKAEAEVALTKPSASYIRAVAGLK